MARSLIFNPPLLRLIFVAACLAGSIRNARPQEQLVQKVETALGGTGAAPVQDFGHLLKPQGKLELERDAARLKQDGINVRYVTVPKETVDAGPMAETVYRDLKLGKGDLLVVFDGKQVYGKSLALEGDRQAFTNAAKEAQAGFKLYYARGLQQFADSLDGAIVQHRHAEVAAKAANQQRIEVIAGGAVLVAVLAIVVVVVRFVRGRIAAAKAFINKLHHAEKLFERIALKMPDAAPRAVRSRFVRLGEELTKAKGAKRGEHGKIDRIVEDCKTLESDLIGIPMAKPAMQSAAEEPVKLQQLG